MEQTVLFRDFEERDIDFIYRCKNDEKLNEMIVGQFHHYSYEEAVNWVHGCMGDHDTYKFWAISTNDDERRIVGWTSLSQIDLFNKSACQHGIVIGDVDYKDGNAMFEALLFTMKYAFVTLDLHRLYCSCLSNHKISPHMLIALGFVLEGEHRDAFIKNNKFYNVQDYSILKTEYNALLTSGMYDINVLTRKFVKSVKSYKK